MIEKDYLTRLVYAKWLFRIGELLLNQKSIQEACTAIIMFDGSVEVVLNILLDYYHDKNPSEKEFYRTLKQQHYTSTIIKIILNNPKLTSDIIEKINFSRLFDFHQLRNQIQHKGFIPIKSQIEEYFSFIRETLKTLSLHILNIDWDSISLAKLIKLKPVRNYYEQAERCYNEKKYKETVVCLIVTFEVAKALQKIDISGSGLSFDRISYIKNKDEDVKNLLKYIKKIDEELEVIKLGLNYKEYRIYHDFSNIGILDSITLPYEIDNEGNVAELTKQNSYGWDFSSDDRLRDWIVFAFDFVLRSIFQWEYQLRAIQIMTL